jgi:hypothetical protein
MIKNDNKKSKHLPSQNHKYQHRKGKSSQPKERLKTPSQHSVIDTDELHKSPRRREKPQSSSSGSAAAVPMAGAVLVGTCLGGPVGLLAGLKIGAFVGLGGSLLGYSTANMMGEQL